MSLFDETVARAAKAEKALDEANKTIARLEGELKRALQELDVRRIELVNARRRAQSLPALPAPKPREIVFAPPRRKLTPDDFALSDDDVKELFKAKKYYDDQDNPPKRPGLLARLLHR